ncbi:MAG: PPC domain-containing protein [Pseudomonadota bacterium]
MKYLRTLAVIVVAAALAACRIEVIVPEGGRVVSQSLTCRGGSICDVDVDDASFNETYRAIPSADRFTFTGWLTAERHWCGGSTAPCTLSTALFAGNDALMALLDDNDQVFFLSPKFEEISDNIYAGATAFTLKEDYVHRGELGGRKVSYDSDSFFGAPVDGQDYFVFVAPASGVVTISLGDLSFDYDLSLETSIRVLELSQNVGTASELIVAQVVEGNTYYIAAFTFDESQGNYQLSVNFEPTSASSAPSDISGVYAPEFSEAITLCTSSGQQFATVEQTDFRISKDGTFVRVISGIDENNSNLIYRVYANDLENGTVIRKDTSVFRDARGEPEILVDSLVTIDFTNNRIVGENELRLVLFDTTDGSVLDDCIVNETYVGEKLADLDGSGDRDVAR